MKGCAMNAVSKNIGFKTQRILRRCGLPAMALALLLSQNAGAETLSASGSPAQTAIDVEKIRAELAHSRQQAQVLNPEDAFNLADSGLEQEQKRLLAAESELLERLSRQTSGAPETPADESKASLDLDKAINELTSAKSPQDQNQGQIRVLKDKQGRTVVSSGRAQAVIKGQPSAEKEAAQPKLESQLSSQQKTISSLQSSNAALRQQLNASERRLSQITRELDETRNRLIIAETEVERLSKIIEERNRSTLSRYIPPDAAPAAAEPRRSASAPVLPEKTGDEMLIATVAVDKAHLRSGPGKNNSPLMSVSRGTRLAVETRHGQWYRVISPTGARAWISSEVVAFGPSRDTSPTRTIKVKGYNPSIEDEASRLVRQSDY